MKTRGKNFGCFVSQAMVRGYQFGGGGRVTSIDFSQILCKYNGLVPCVLDIEVVLPEVSFTPAAAPTRGTNYLDGIFMADLVQTWRLQTASNAPFAKTPASGVILDNVGWKGLQALSYITGRPVMPFNSHRYQVGPLAGGVAVPAGPVPPSTALFVPGTTRDYDWFPKVAPFSILDSAAPAEVKLRPRYTLPIGRRRGEDGGLMPIPAAYFSGKPWAGSCADGTPGRLEFTTRTETHGQQLTWDTNGKVDVIITYILVPAENIPVPLALQISETKYNSQYYSARPMGTAFMAFQNDLDANGNMIAEDYSQVSVTLNGDVIVSQNEDEHDLRVMSQDNYVFGDAFRANRSQSPFAYDPIAGQNTIVGSTPFGCSRYMTPYLMVNDGDASLLKLPGADDAQLQVNVIQGQSTHTLIQGGYYPQTADSQRAHTELFLTPGNAILPETLTGNYPTDSAANAALPGKQLSRKTQ